MSEKASAKNHCYAVQIFRASMQYAPFGKIIGFNKWKFSLNKMLFTLDFRVEEMLHPITENRSVVLFINHMLLKVDKRAKSLKQILCYKKKNI